MLDILVMTTCASCGREVAVPVLLALTEWLCEDCAKDEALEQETQTDRRSSAN